MVSGYAQQLIGLERPELGFHQRSLVSFPLSLSPGGGLIRALGAIFS